MSRDIKGQRMNKEYSTRGSECSTNNHRPPPLIVWEKIKYWSIQAVWGKGERDKMENRDLSFDTFLFSFWLLDLAGVRQNVCKSHKGFTEPHVMGDKQSLTGCIWKDEISFNTYLTFLKHTHFNFYWSKYFFVFPTIQLSLAFSLDSSNKFCH